MDWREPTHLYHYDGAMRLFCRHLDLSDDVGYRFSNRSWDGWPLTADRYADWLREAWGDFVFVGWDFETFGEHHRADSGIFEFLDHLPDELARRGVGFLTPSEALERFAGHGVSTCRCRSFRRPGRAAAAWSSSWATRRSRPSSS